ncbi:hypothetical protein HUU40_06000 [candidate division KSB1 bacterium]|nr:hypothetical protein [candidate division KSB1 bacterium]
MTRSKYLGSALALALLCAVSASAQTTIYGGRGLMRVFTAEPIGGKQFFINSFFQTFLESPDQRQNLLGKDHTLSLGFTLGLSNSLEFNMQVVPYQDDQQNAWGPPGDTQLGLKMALPFAVGGISTGLRGFVNLPTAKNHNVPYEPYSSGKVGGGIQGLATIDMTESFPLVPLKAYLNFGYFDHTLDRNFFIGHEDQFLVGAGLKFPIRSITFYTEYTGEIFANNALVGYAESSTRVSQGIKVLGPWNLILDFAVDVGLDKPAAVRLDPLQKEYADWKVILGMNYQVAFNRQGGVSSTQPGRRTERRADPELERVRIKRESAKEDLEDMEKSLQESNDSEKKEKP